MTVLTQTQLDILNGYATAGNRVAYYNALSSYGYGYGELALGVVNDDGISGMTANRYFLDTANSEGVNISEADLLEISLGLMEADIALRTAFGGADLSAQQIQDYHEDVFLGKNVSSNAWTVDYYLNSFETPAEKQAAWEEMLSQGSIATDLPLRISSSLS